MKMFDWFKKLKLEKEMQEEMARIDADRQAQAAEFQAKLAKELAPGVSAVGQQLLTINNPYGTGNIIGASSTYGASTYEQHLRGQIDQLERRYKADQIKLRSIEERATEMAHLLLVKINTGLNPEQIEKAMNLVAEQLNLTGEGYDH